MDKQKARENTDGQTTNSMHISWKIWKEQFHDDQWMEELNLNDWDRSNRQLWNMRRGNLEKE